MQPLPDISSPRETCVWLTERLRSRGALTSGHVTTVQYRENDAFNSDVIHATLAYSSDATGIRPPRLLIKQNRDHAGQAEVDFYRLIAGSAGHPAVMPTCFVAEYDATTGDTLLVLTDLSDSHISPVTREQLLSGDGVPRVRWMDQVVECIGRFHAYWWEHPRLGDGVTAVRGWYRDASSYDAHIARRQGEFRRFRESVGESIPSTILRLYAHVLDCLPVLWDRYLAGRVMDRSRITLTHGDCYLTQFLCPIDSLRTDTVVVDFQDVSANFGAFDLVYLMTTFWSSQQRSAARREVALLRRYHDVLSDNGVRGYAFEQLLADYQLMVILMMFDPVFNQDTGSSRAYWWPKMRCLVSAYHDLECEQLLEPRSMRRM